MSKASAVRRILLEKIHSAYRNSRSFSARWLRLDGFAVPPIRFAVALEYELLWKQNRDARTSAVGLVWRI
jgi:hypothetical protein